MVDLDDVKRVDDGRQELFKRWDDDKELAALADYELKDRRGRRVTGIINVTLPIPGLFAAHVKAMILKAAEGYRVTGRDRTDEQNSPIEHFIPLFLAAADRRHRRQGGKPSNGFSADMTNLRGRSIYRVATHLKGDTEEVVPDFVPVDPRRFAYEYGEDGFMWGAHTMAKSGAQILGKHPAAKRLAQVTGSEKVLRFVDIWEPEINTQWVNGQKIDEQENTYEEVPFIQELVPKGLLTEDDDGWLTEGEGIFYLIRGIVPEMNRLASIMQTQNMSGVKPPRQYKSRAGDEGIIPERADEPGTTSAVEDGTSSGFSLLDMPDIDGSDRMMWEILNIFAQLGSLSQTTMGSTPFPMSAVALIELGENQGEVFLPNLGTYGLAKQEAMVMAIRQIQGLGVSSIELGTHGHKQTFKVSELEGDYDISLIYDPQDPSLDIARMNVADVARRFYDEETILRDILKAPDPSEIMRRKRIERSKAIAPEIEIVELADALIEEGEFEKARIMVDRFEASIEQLAAGNVPSTSQGLPGEQPASNLLNAGPGTKSDSNRRADERRSLVRAGTEGGQ
jgi:hypothetical protein